MAAPGRAIRRRATTGRVDAALGAGSAVAIPILRCDDLERALGFYLDTLGAVLRWREAAPPGPGYAAVR